MKRKRITRSTKRSSVPLETKLKPLQRRAHTTYDTILAAAGALLEEVGIERLSTNLVCRRAGLTPPALYRYFPNKYALLKELGVRLMAAQDEAVFTFIEEYGAAPGTPAEQARRIKQIQKRVNEITHNFPGGAWVMRALRSVPRLSAVRIASREAVAEKLYEALRRRFPSADRKDLRLASTLCIEVGYAATELLADQPELDSERINLEVALILAHYQESFADPRRKNHAAQDEILRRKKALAVIR
jgi:AcrR family transcriptional regulator